MEATEDPAPDPGVAASDDCYRCGYALRGIADEQPCPECGLVALRSRRPSDELHNTRPRWLRRISLGAGLMLVALLSVPVWPVLLSLALDWALAPGRPRRAYSLWRTASWATYELSAVVFLVGVLFLTSREGYPPADRADRWRRLALRVAAAAPLAVPVTGYVNFQLSPPFYHTGRAGLDLLVFVAVTAGCAPLPLLLFGHLRSLAVRARSPQLAQQCRVVGIGAAVTILCVAGATVLFANTVELGLGRDWSSRSDVALLILLAVYGAAILFPLWGLSLLAVFAVAFGRVARRLRAQWLHNDRALAIRS